jgi:hypothetical protein
MLPDWLTKPESLFRIGLWFTSPIWGWWVGKVLIRRVEGWHASRTESAARARLIYLHKALDDPPTLFESLAYIVCFLPLPIVLTSMLVVLYFMPHPPSPFPLEPHLARAIAGTFISVLALCNYFVFGVLAVHGIQVAYRLRHGVARYGENYRAGTQKRIDRLKEKFPKLAEEFVPTVTGGTHLN